jgi:tyrosine-protein phosphatase SIW14
MRLKLKTRSAIVTFVAAVALIAASSAHAQVAPTGATGAVVAIPGVPNAGSVTGNLFRGAQPKDSAYADLQKLGMNIIVDLRGESGEVSSEKKAVEEMGMKFVNLPWSGAGLPSRDELLTFFTLLRDNPDKKVFLHCQYGADRTGVMIALYRIAVDHWTSEQAIKEMKDFHYHSFMLPHLAKYVKAFPAELAADPSLAGAVPGARPVQPVVPATKAAVN